jgi:cyclic pyranopterin phosphate synthase
MLYTCLFASQGYDLRQYLRNPVPDQVLTHSDTTISNLIAAIWQNRGDRYSELRRIASDGSSTKSQKIEMSYIGG